MAEPQSRPSLSGTRPPQDQDKTVGGWAMTEPLAWAGIREARGVHLGLPGDPGREGLAPGAQVLSKKMASWGRLGLFSSELTGNIF